MTIVSFVKGMNYGDGFDTLSLQPRGTAITFFGSPSPISDAGGQAITFSLQRVSNLEDFQQALDIKVDVSVSYGLFSASATLEFAKSVQFHSFSDYIVAKVSVENPLRQIQDPDIKVKPSAATLITSGHPSEFRNAFGDFFVKGIQTGGAYYGVLEFTGQSQMEQKTIKSKLDAGAFGLFSAHAQFSESISSLKEVAGLRVFNHQLGGDQVEQPRDVDKIIERASKFPAEVLHSGIPVQAFIIDYKSLNLPPINVPHVENAKQVLSFFLIHKMISALN
jgi:hypothetical protein